MAFDDAANDLRERLEQHAIIYCSADDVCTHDGSGQWLCTSFSESYHNVSFFGLNASEAAELIRTFDAMQMAKARPIGARNL